MPQLCTFGASSARGFGLTEETGPGLPDDQFNLTTLLLPGNGTNGAQNNTFLDSSTNNLTITRNGNTTQGTFSPFSQTGWSNYFAGGGTYLSTPNSSTVYTNFGTADFCIECWVFPTSAPSEATLIANGPDGTTSGTFVLYLYRSGDIQLFYNTGAGVAVLGSGSASSPTANTWSHIALTRQSGTVRCFVNGVSKFSGTVSGNLGTASGTSTIGTRTGQTSSNSWPGNISNLRIVKNAAVYTAAFTPPTAPLTAISGTSLLTCQSNRFVDNSANAFALTVNGNVSVQAFSPFNPDAPYSTTSVGGSAYFDGSGDYLSVPDNTAWNFGSGDFTVEAWYYPTVASAQQIIIGQWDGAGGGTGLNFVLLTSNNTSMFLRAAVSSDGANVLFDLISTSALRLNAWNHVALVRSGTTFQLYLNGAAASNGSTTSSASLFNATNVLTVGASSAGGQLLTGYISSVRIVKGTAVYTGSTYTVPTTPPTAIANTSLLLNYTNGGITDATAKGVFETVGSAQISTAQSKWGGSSIAFDGNADYLTSPVSTLYEFGTGDFTVELWVRFNSTSGTVPMVNLGYGYNGTPLGAYNAWGVVIINNVFYFSRYLTDGSSNDFTASWTPATNTWYHVAVSRQGTSLRAFIDGTQLGTTQTNSVNYVRVNSDPLYIGQYFAGSANRYLNGYIDDLRITKGLARYTANFTPPTAPFPLL